MPEVARLAGANSSATMALSCARVLSAAAVAAFPPLLAQSWSDRTERFSTESMFADAGPLGAPLAIHGLHVHAWDGQAWDRLCALPAGVASFHGFCFDRARGEVIAILGTSAYWSNAATYRL